MSENVKLLFKIGTLLPKNKHKINNQNSELLDLLSNALLVSNWKGLWRITGPQSFHGAHIDSTGNAYKIKQFFVQYSFLIGLFSSLTNKMGSFFHINTTFVVLW